MASLAVNPCSVNYFYGRISRDEAESILRRNGCQEGLYLLRENMSVAGNYALSICHQMRYGLTVIVSYCSLLFIPWTPYGMLKSVVHFIYLLYTWTQWVKISWCRDMYTGKSMKVTVGKVRLFVNVSVHTGSNHEKAWIRSHRLRADALYLLPLKVTLAWQWLLRPMSEL